MPRFEDSLKYGACCRRAWYGLGLEYFPTDSCVQRQGSQMFGLWGHRTYQRIDALMNSQLTVLLEGRMRGVPDYTFEVVFLSPLLPSLSTFWAP